MNTDDKRQTNIKDFIVLKLIGKGSYGKVYKARRKEDNQVYAIKTIDLTKMNQDNKQKTLNEIRILCSVDSKYVVSYNDAFLEKKGSQLCIGKTKRKLII